MTASQNTDLLARSCMPRGVGRLLTGSIPPWRGAGPPHTHTTFPYGHAFPWKWLGESMDLTFKQQHAERMQDKKSQVQAAMARAQVERGIVVLLTGHGKGKTTSAFGMLYRALGHGLRAGVVQFITGTHASGEVTFLQQQGLLGQGAMAQVDYHAMATGCSWQRSDWDADLPAANQAWQVAQRMLADPSLRLVVLDELTFMLQYGYLALPHLQQALERRPAGQSVVITGRSAPAPLLALADTVSEIADTRHAFQAGVKAQAGVDF